MTLTYEPDPGSTVPDTQVEGPAILFEVVAISQTNSRTTAVLGHNLVGNNIWSAELAASGSRTRVELTQLARCDAGKASMWG